MATAAPGMTHGSYCDKRQEEAAQRRFREVHFHRFVLGSRSNVHGACLLRSQLPVRLPRPHTMQLRYDHPPPGVGYRRLSVPDWSEDIDHATYGRMVLEHRRSAMAEIKDECEKTARCILMSKDVVRTHVAVATQSGLLFFVAGFGYWNVLDIDLKLKNESCVGVKVFEAMVDNTEDVEAALADSQGDTSFETTAEARVRQKEGPVQRAIGLPVTVIALTTYVKNMDGKKADGSSAGTYRLYALGAESLPAVSQEFIDKHAINAQEAKIGPKQSTRESSVDTARAKSGPADDSPTNNIAASIATVEAARSKSLPSQLEPGASETTGIVDSSDAAS
ncbi:hypothetical protein IWW45_009382, partial [Coemansia sp. RSA 485]